MSLLQRFDDWLMNELAGRSGFEQPTLQQTTQRTQKQQEEYDLRREFEEYEKRHFVVGNDEFLSMMGCVEAYKSRGSRKEFLDNRTVYQPQVSTDRIAVYLRGMYEIQELYICIHGTRLTSIQDILQDIQVIENSVRSSPFTIEIMKDLLRIRGAYQGIENDSIYISGHSLGAIYSLLGSRILNVNGYGFNGAAPLINLGLFTTLSVFDMLYDLKDIQNYDKFVSYRISGDPISLLSKWALKNVVNIDVVGLAELSPLAKHSMETFLNVCIPLVPLDNSSLSRARRSGRLNDERERVQQEGQEFQQLQERVEQNPLNPLNEMLKYLNPMNAFF